MIAEKTTFKTSDVVDFVIIGSGAAGGVLAKELSTNGFRVVVLEQGPYLTPADFVHDEIKVFAGGPAHQQAQAAAHLLPQDPTGQGQAAACSGSRQNKK